VLRPRIAPWRIPAWGWELHLWWKHGRKGPRPKNAPVHVPAWFWLWHVWRLAREHVVKPAPVPPTPVPKPKPKPTPYPEKGADFVSGPAPAQDKAAGIRFVMRYLSTPGNPKNISKPELAALSQAGIRVGLVFETTGKTFLGGHAAGVADAKLAQAQVAALGHPAVVVYFAVDTDPHGHETQIVAYIQGAASVLGKARVGVYGGYAAVKACLDAGVCAYAWQTYAWSAGMWDRRAHLRQVENGVHVAGHGVDIDTALGNFGAL
jgi:glycoside hydrolase-like protein